ncbi:MAG: BamA/TamA family outer membrane protein [Bacteroidota bacterium]|nr:BamA/TamA family outer membrane protein [Bacteroidota bacterium]
MRPFPLDRPLVRVYRFCILVAALTANLMAQTAGERPRAAHRYVIHRLTITVLADSTESEIPVSPAQLQGVVGLQPTMLSVPARILREITYNGLDVRDFPRPITMIFARAYAEAVEHDLRYFDRAAAEMDVARLGDYLNQFGYHDVQVRYIFRVRDRARNNELEYIVRLGKRYMLDTVVVLGLEHLPLDVRTSAEQVLASLKLPQPYREDLVRLVVEAMMDTLRNRGYIGVTYAMVHDSTTQQRQRRFPQVVSDTVRKRDSVTVFVDVGSRYRVGTVSLIDSTRGNPIVGSALKERQLAIAPGQWYSPRRLDQSIANLMALGTFDRIWADTASIGDSLVNIRLHVYYRRVWEATVGWFFNSTFPDNFNNTGIDFSYVHRNVFNAAQAVTMYVRPTLRNTSYFAQILPDSGLGRSFALIDKDLEGGLLFTQPDWFRISPRLRVDANAQATVSYRFIVDPFKLFSLSWRAGVMVPLQGFDERVQVDVSVEAQRPEAFDQALQRAVERNPGVDTLLIRETLDQYRLLNSYTRGQLKWTSAILALRYFRDFRNDLFYPSRGNTLTMFVETTIARLLAGYSQVQMTYTTYHPAGSGVAAFKFRGGWIWWHDPASTIVPFDRHYFAGGAISIRGYPSRQLVDLRSGGTNPSEVGTLTNYIGSGTIIELSAELRYSLSYYEALGDFLASQVSRLGVVFFADAGNAFNRLTRESYGTASVTDVLNPSRWAWVVGSGIRYALPAGPARLDFGIRIYDPMQPERRWITLRRFLGSIEWQIGIGHAF